MHPIITKDDFLAMYQDETYGKRALDKCGRWLPLEPSSALAGLVADMMCDGCLQVSKRNGRENHHAYFGFFSKDKPELEDFNSRLFGIFGVKGKIRAHGKRDFGFSMGCIVCNAALSRTLMLCGVPANDKVSQVFSIPEWITKGSNEIRAAFLRRAFECEGSVGYDRSKDSWEIRFFNHKTRDLYSHGIAYMNSYRFLLREFSIETTNAYVDSTNVRTKDGKESVGFCFKLYKPISILNYAKHIGFDSARKQARLAKAVLWARKGRVVRANEPAQLSLVRAPVL